VVAVSDNYFAALHIPVLEGRAIADTDRPGSRGVVVISESVARHYWPNRDVIGQRIRLNSESGWLTIVGVTRNVIDDWFRNVPSSIAYISYAQFPAASARFLIRSNGNPILEAPAARHVIHRIDRELPVYDVKTMEQALSEERGGVKAAAQNMSTFAVIALLLAVTGIYGVISYFVAARTHDIGVRMALGARRADVLRMTMAQSGRLIAIGVAIGIPVSILLARTMSSVLFNVVNVDPRTFAGVTGVLVMASLAASYVPARRAMGIDPMSALREE
jgi:predicted permease